VKRILFFLFSVLAFSPVFPADAASAEPADHPLVLAGGMLLDGYEADPLHDAVVVIERGRIVAANTRSRVDIPSGARMIDTRGKTIMPGLIDLHIHLDLIGHGDYERYYRFLRGLDRLPEAMPIAAKQMMRAGVTSAVDLGTPFQILETRRRIDAGEIPGPRLTISGPWITRIAMEGVPEGYENVVSSPAEARRATRENIEQGADVIKTWLGLTANDFAAVVEEAHKHGVKVHSHVYQPEAIRLAIDAGVDVLQHVGSARNPPYDSRLLQEISHRQIPVVQTVSHRIWVYPATVAFPGRLQNPVLERDMPADFYAELQDSFRDFHRLSYFTEIGVETRNAARAGSQFIEANAYMGVGTDAASPMNFHFEAMWREMSALVDLGMSEIQVISAATKTGAEILGKSRELGTLEPGKLADLIVVDGNPLADINAMKHVVMTMKGGVPWFDPHGPVLQGLDAVGRRY
jgi:imidazolonepropionase-like amidohydrolase